MACVGACRRDRDVHRDDAGDQCCGSVDRHAADEALRHWLAYCYHRCIGSRAHQRLQVLRSQLAHDVFL